MCVVENMFILHSLFNMCGQNVIISGQKMCYVCID